MTVTIPRRGLAAAMAALGLVALGAGTGRAQQPPIRVGAFVATTF